MLRVNRNKLQGGPTLFATYSFLFLNTQYLAPSVKYKHLTRDSFIFLWSYPNHKFSALRNLTSFPAHYGNNGAKIIMFPAVHATVADHCPNKWCSFDIAWWTYTNAVDLTISWRLTFPKCVSLHLLLLNCNPTWLHRALFMKAVRLKALHQCMSFLLPIRKVFANIP